MASSFSLMSSNSLPTSLVPSTSVMKIAVRPVRVFDSIFSTFAFSPIFS